jgi:hypothetical protein
MKREWGRKKEGGQNGVGRGRRFEEEEGERRDNNFREKSEAYPNRTPEIGHAGTRNNFATDNKSVNFLFACCKLSLQTVCHAGNLFGLTRNWSGS